MLNCARRVDGGEAERGNPPSQEEEASEQAQAARAPVQDSRLQQATVGYYSLRKAQVMIASDPKLQGLSDSSCWYR